MDQLEPLENAGVQNSPPYTYINWEDEHLDDVTEEVSKDETVVYSQHRTKSPSYNTVGSLEKSAIEVCQVEFLENSRSTDTDVLEMKDTRRKLNAMKTSKEPCQILNASRPNKSNGNTCILTPGPMPFQCTDCKKIYKREQPYMLHLNTCQSKLTKPGNKYWHKLGQGNSGWTTYKFVRLEQLPGDTPITKNNQTVRQCQICNGHFQKKNFCAHKKLCKAKEQARTHKTSPLLFTCPLCSNEYKRQNIYCAHLKKCFRLQSMKERKVVKYNKLLSDLQSNVSQEINKLPETVTFSDGTDGNISKFRSKDIAENLPMLPDEIKGKSVLTSPEPLYVVQQQSMEENAILHDMKDEVDVQNIKIGDNLLEIKEEVCDSMLDDPVHVSEQFITGDLESESFLECGDCPERFPDIEALEFHIRLFHTSSNNLPHTQSDGSDSGSDIVYPLYRKKIICRFCGKNCGKKRLLRRHKIFCSKRFGS